MRAMSTQLSDILQLSVAERIQLAEDIWDSIAAFPEAVELTEAQRQVLDQRLLSFAQNPKEGISWQELKRNLLKSR
jgi:putative addiction module component (TIGR02574 family)